MYPACQATELSGKVGRLWHYRQTNDQGMFLAVKPLGTGRCMLSAMTPKGDLLALATSSGSVYCLHLDHNRFSLLEDAERTAVAATFMARTTRRLFVAFNDNSLACYDVNTSAQVARLTGSRSTIQSLSLKANSEQLASASSDSIALWDTRTLRQQRLVQVVRDSACICITCSRSRAIALFNDTRNCSSMMLFAMHCRVCRGCPMAPSKQASAQMTAHWLQPHPTAPSRCGVRRISCS